MPQDDEDTLVASLLGQRHPARPAAPRIGPGDDAAVLRDGTAVTVDALVEGVHFDARLSPDDVGHKAIAASVSDLAAMGARPAWAVLTLAVPHADPAFDDGFARGFSEACTRWGVDLVGGDTVRSPGPRMISVTMGGPVVAEPMTRSGAQPGDVVFATGTLGLAGAGWMLDAPPPEALAALRRPDPPVAFALALARSGVVTAAMDLSDGLAVDLPRLARASGVGAVVRPADLPGHPVLGDTPVPFQVGGGEDYQLLFTVPPDAASLVTALAAGHGVRCTAIGRITDGDQVVLEGMDWPQGWSHFREGRA